MPREQRQFIRDMDVIDGLIERSHDYQDSRAGNWKDQAEAASRDAGQYGSDFTTVAVQLGRGEGVYVSGHEAARIFFQCMTAALSVGHFECPHADPRAPKPTILNCDPPALICKDCLPEWIRYGDHTPVYNEECDRCGRYSQKMHEGTVTVGFVTVYFNECPRCHKSTEIMEARDGVQG